MVAYLQKLGRDLKAAQKSVAVTAVAAAESKNPYAGNHAAEEEGEKIFKENCRSCHGEKGAGGFGPKLATTVHKFGGADAELFASVAGGRPGGNARVPSAARKGPGVEGGRLHPPPGKGRPMTPRALAYLLFTLLLAGIFAGIIAYYFNRKRYERVESPKHRMLADDDPSPDSTGDGREG